MATRPAPGLPPHARSPAPLLPLGVCEALVALLAALVQLGRGKHKLAQAAVRARVGHFIIIRVFKVSVFLICRPRGKLGRGGGKRFFFPGMLGLTREPLTRKPVPRQLPLHKLYA